MNKVSLERSARTERCDCIQTKKLVNINKFEEKAIETKLPIPYCYNKKSKNYLRSYFKRGRPNAFPTESILDKSKT